MIFGHNYFISEPIFKLFAALFRTHELQKDGMVIFFLWCFRKVRFRKIQFLKDGVQTVTIHAYRPHWLSWVVRFKILFGCHDVLILGKSSIKWRQRPDITIAVDWDINSNKQTNKQSIP